jgi:hypothetical protein
MSLRLAALVAAAQQQDEGAAALLEIDPVTRTIVNPKLAYPLANRSDIARQPFGQAQESGGDDGPRPTIS